MSNARIAGAVAVAMVALSGCADGNAPGDATPPRGLDATTADAVQQMRQGASYEFVPYESPAAMEEAVDIATAGKVVSLDEGVVADELDGRGIAVVGIEPTDTWKEDSEAPSVVYFQFPRAQNLSIDFYRDTLPIGTEIAMFGFDLSATSKLAEGDPGDIVYTLAPQGLFIPVPRDGLVNVWGEDTTSGGAWAGIDSIEDLAAALE